MSLVIQYKVLLSGWGGGPGVNTLHALSFEEGQPSQQAISEFGDILSTVYQGMKSYFVPGCSITLLPDVKVLNVGDASLHSVRAVNTWSLDTGTGSSLTSRATMVKLRFQTDRVRGNRLMKGGIFFGPVDQSALTGAGELNETCRLTMANAWDGAIDINITDQLRLAVYGRPDPENKNPAMHEGVTGYVQNVSCMPTPAVLRSRRD
jgi:hypothetical protein